MKNLILTTTFITAGTLAAFATAPTGTYYMDGSDEQQSLTFDEYCDGGEYSYGLSLNSSGTYKDVIINSNASTALTYVSINIGAGVTFEGFKFNAESVEYGLFYDNVGSVLGGNIVFSKVGDSYIKGKLSSGTHFSIDLGSQVRFYSNIWDIAAEADLTQPLVEGAGTVRMSSTDIFTLNFRSAELLKEQTISLVSLGTQVDKDSSEFKNIAITVDGKVVNDYTATQINGGRDISIKYVPEPSMFGLLAGTLALALAGTRRRRSRKFN